jgi:hypothetical protein
MAKIESSVDCLVQSTGFFAAPNEASRKIVIEQSSTQFNVSCLTLIVLMHSLRFNPSTGEEVCH